MKAKFFLKLHLNEGKILFVLSAKPVSDGSIQEVTSRAVSDLEFENHQLDY